MVGTGTDLKVSENSSDMEDNIVRSDFSLAAREV